MHVRHLSVKPRKDSAISRVELASRRSLTRGESAAAAEPMGGRCRRALYMSQALAMSSATRAVPLRLAAVAGRRLRRPRRRAWRQTKALVVLAGLNSQLTHPAGGFEIARHAVICSAGLTSVPPAIAASPAHARLRSGSTLPLAVRPSTISPSARSAAPTCRPPSSSSNAVRQAAAAKVAPAGDGPAHPGHCVPGGAPAGPIARRRRSPPRTISEREPGPFSRHR